MDAKSTGLTQEELKAYLGILSMLDLTTLYGQAITVGDDRMEKACAAMIQERTS